MTALHADQTAIVGMAALLPGAGDLDGYWRNLVEGADAISEMPSNRVDPQFYDPAQAHRPDRLYCRRGGFVDGLATFDPVRFGIMPASICDIEPDQLITLRVAAAAIDDAGGVDRLPAGDRVGVILGRGGFLSPGQVRYYQRIRMSNQVIQVLGELIPDLPESRLEAIRQRFVERLGEHHPEGAIGVVPNLAASRVANRLDLRGPAYTVDAACASSLVAVDQAIAELNRGRLDVVLAGGVHHVHDVGFWAVFNQLGALSRRGEIRPFDRAADGLLIGEGTGIVVLKRMADALRDGDRIYAVIRGSGVSSDGRAASMVNPAAAGQALAIRSAWAAAGLDPAAPDALGMLEAHGTATPTGDAAELDTLAEVFGPHAGGPKPVIGSVKSMIGHAMPAAGIAGLIKAALAVYRGVLLPTLHCDDPRPELAHTRFAPIGSARPWESDGPRRAGVNAFGFGGINAHVILEETPDALAARRGGTGAAGPVTGSATPPAAEAAVRAGAALGVEQPDEVLWLAASDPAALARLLDTDDNTLRTLGAARARQAGGAHEQGEDERCRLGIVDPDAKRLATARLAVARGQSWRGARDIWFSPAPLLGGEATPAGAGRIAFVFPGIEAEFSPRTADVAAHFGLPDRQWSAADLGRHGAGLIELGKLLTDALSRVGITPDAVAGYSLGEWTAAVTGGQLSAFSVDEVVAELNAASVEVPGHAFAVVGAAAQRIGPWLARYPGVVLSHDNAPEQCIVNGPESDIDRLVEALRGKGLVCQKLPFRSAFHTPLFASGLESIGAALHRWEVQAPRVPVWSTTLKAPFPGDPAGIREISVRHMLEPVWFRETVQAMYDAGFRVFLQVGVGQLASVIDDNLRERDHLAMPVNVAHRSGLHQLRRVATALWVEGAAPDLRALGTTGTGHARAGAPAAARSARRGPIVRLELGVPLVHLGDGADDLLGMPARAAEPAIARAAAAGGGSDTVDGVRTAAVATHTAVATHATVATQATVPAPRSPALAALHKLAGQSSAAAELASLLGGATGGVVAGGAESGGGTEPTQPTQPTPTSPPPDAHRTVLRVALDTMPYLRDHCFFAQPDDWPHPEDRWPVVPATTVMQHMMDAAQQAAPGSRVLAVRDARFNRWCVAAPPQDVEITVKPAGPGLFSVAFGGYARSTIEVGPDYPAERPQVWRHDPATERPPLISAEQMYAERFVFHGPRFRGVSEVHAVGDTHVRGVLTALPQPGALLDNASQLMGNWLFTTQPYGALPVGIGHARFFGPSPAPGTAVDCVVRVRSLEAAQLVFESQLAVDGEVWAQLEGCVHRRFFSHPEIRPAERIPQRHPMSLRQPEGWTVAFDRWPDLVSRGLAARGILGARGVAEYERQPAKARKQWLLGRIAVNDAVRSQLWDDGHTDVYPIELTVSNDPNGRPRVHPRPGRGYRECDVSLAHVADIAVAIAKPRTPGAPADAAGVGIDVTEITDHPDSTITFALSDSERRLLDSKVATGEDRWLWFARFWAAKEAAAKAEGSGLAGDPRRFKLVAATPAALTVEVAGRVYLVAHREVANPEGLPPRRYVVGWTWGPQPVHPTGRP
ncbi:beta-ketoacyl synthase N-terminal-like domain-containing protein [Dactylosporangium sp. NPDC051484]|uniref:beta-ketoacyl synthase N-terminal-like domain-containing protein n=1 Tax=Dactylosporangium sp. NPDC051484 TaxID=3154942 RepID=UPI00344C6E46